MRVKMVKVSTKSIIMNVALSAISHKFIYALNFKFPQQNLIIFKSKLKNLLIFESKFIKLSQITKKNHIQTIKILTKNYKRLTKKFVLISLFQTDY